MRKRREISWYHPDLKEQAREFSRILLTRAGEIYEKVKTNRTMRTHARRQLGLAYASQVWAIEFDSRKGGGSIDKEN